MEGTSKRKRKLPSRCQELNEDEPFSPKTGSITKPRRRNAPDIPEPVAEDDDITLNVDGDTEQVTSGNKRPTKGKGRADGQSARKKARKLVIESDGEDDNYPAEEVAPEEKEDSDDDYHSSEEEKPKASKSKTKAPATRGTKRKAKGDPANSRPALERRTSTELLTSNKKRVKLTLKLGDSLVDGDAVSTPDTSDKTSPATLKYDSPAPQVKKVKLPAIKKTKLPGATGSATPTSAAPAPKPKLPLDIGVGSKTVDVRKSQIATFDLDLSNKSVYQELFKTGSDGSTPRKGLNRRTKEEERRKELNKLKEEYLAKRAEEEAHSFDLQAQQDKIAMFEDKLKYHRSAALHPNYIAAKWKELYDKENGGQRNNQNGTRIFTTGERKK